MIGREDDDEIRLIDCQHPGALFQPREEFRLSAGVGSLDTREH